jgi:hypothetical protein
MNTGIALLAYLARLNAGLVGAARQTLPGMRPREYRPR